MKTSLALFILLLASLAGCAGMMGHDSDPQVLTAKTASKFHQREWNLRTMTVDGRQIVMDIDSRITIRFDADGQVAGFASVNRFSGTYSLSADGKLIWDKPGYVATRRAGPPELMEKERVFLGALDKTNTAILSSRMLQLQSEDSTTIFSFKETGY
jgi:heat shock protein HslJ